MAQTSGDKPRFIRKNGKVIPIGGKKSSGDNKTNKKGGSPIHKRKGARLDKESGAFLSKGQSKKVRKLKKEDRSFDNKRKKVINTAQKFGVEIGVSLGAGIGAVLKRSNTVKGASIGGIIGLLSGTARGVSEANKRIGTRPHLKVKKHKNEQGF